MIADLGTNLILLSMFLAAANVFIGFYPVVKTQWQTIVASLNFICITVIFSLLIYAFIISDFSIINVYLNSSTAKPLIYKISGSWASHEGSIILWVWLFALYSFLVYIFGSKTIVERNANAILAFLGLSFLSFIYFTSNPFAKVANPQAEGLGLNPMLQDVALAIHPPILYSGYVLYAIPFALALASLLRRDVTTECLHVIKFYSRIAWTLLTAGVTLGSWWAYRELGWGGYWFFDPVENAALMPWILATAMHHLLIVTMGKRQVLPLTFLLVIATFLLCLFGTFLVRSGVITSVHSFASDPTRGMYIISFVTFLTVSSLSIYVFNIKHINIVPTPHMLRSYAIIIASIFFISACSAVLFGTIYPIYYNFVTGKNISLGPPYYITTFIPLMLMPVMIAAITSYDRYSEVYFKRIVHYIIIALLPVIGAKYYFDINSLIAIIGIFAGSLLMITTIYAVIINTEFFKQDVSVNKAAMYLGHFGIAFVVLAISFNAVLQKEVNFIGRLDDKVMLQNYQIKLHDIRYAMGQNYLRQIAEFYVTDQAGNEIAKLQPEHRLYKIENTTTSDTDVHSFMLFDLYAGLNKVTDDVVHARFYYKPAMTLLWLSIFIMLSGTLLGFICKPNPRVQQ